MIGTLVIIAMNNDDRELNHYMLEETRIREIQQVEPNERLDVVIRVFGLK
ncbi:hypothetical protein GCM10007877_20080 [Marinibactrum halimedae]|uniref:Uncharacterized protein n=1 Tax=Marinibactrum halimedae TaxID=1444977 RepID=A0AA37T774_9GAMM|nr:hypothetical protein GCM10007877_20080 [Marinibactrum halimedae]